MDDRGFGIAAGTPRTEVIDIQRDARDTMGGQCVHVGGDQRTCSGLRLTRGGTGALERARSEFSQRKLRNKRHADPCVRRKPEV
jgi:hypothetical protein